MLQRKKKSKKLKEDVYGLPLSIKDENYCIIPIGFVIEIESYNKLGMSKNTHNQYNTNPVNGNTVNLAFKDNDNQEIKLLTKKDILIESAI